MTDSGTNRDPDGESRTTNPSAPPSAGRPHGSSGVVETDPGGPDNRPVVPEESPMDQMSGPTAEEDTRPGEALDEGDGHSKGVLDEHLVEDTLPPDRDDTIPGDDRDAPADELAPDDRDEIEKV